MSLIQNAKKFPISAKSTKATQVLGKALCVASEEFFCRLAVKYNDGIWDRKLKLCLSKSQDNNNNNNNINNNNNNNDNNNNNTTNNNVYSALFSYSFIALYNDYAK